MAKNKPKSRPRRRSHERGPLQKPILLVVILILALSVLGGFWFLSKLGPRDVDYLEVDILDGITDEMLALRNESVELEAKFEEILEHREPSPEDIELLKKARDLQARYVDGVGQLDSDAARRLRELNARFQNVAVVELQEQSLALEEEARALAAKNKYEEARAKYREAYQLQDTINQHFPQSTAYNVGRATSLDRQSSYLSAEPLRQKSLEFQAQAEELIAAQNWEQAEDKLAQAITVQDQLNRDFRGTNQASVARLERLRAMLVAVRSGQSHVEVEKVSAQADAKMALGKNLEAARLYLEAARLQRELNAAFQKSAHASTELVADFQRKAETVQSFTLGRQIERNHNLLKQLLSERRTHEAAEVIVELRKDIQQMKGAYPRSSLNDEELLLKIRYLNLVQSDLGFIQERIYDSLLPIPEVEEWRILRTEVSQALFSLIMGRNPSRNLGDVNPVDSVSWIEAKQFCERLSWIMGKPVRLPTEDEFRASLGRLRYEQLEEYVWGLSETNGISQPIGKKLPFASGCHDLLGNISEWLESVDRLDTEDARHIGGHALDRLETIFTVPVRDAPRDDRNRMTGFRIVLQVG
ncbi:MAG: SUMF1/EgtB/PvdO family nonheme iron enzyme [Opitutales bacterium]